MSGLLWKQKRSSGYYTSKSKVEEMIHRSNKSIIECGITDIHFSIEELEIKDE